MRIHGTGHLGAARIRMLEKAERELHPQHAAHRLVHGRHRQLALLEQLGDLGVVEVGHHVHLDTGFQRLLRGGGGIERDAVVGQFHHRGVVADHEAVEAPFLAQDLVHQVRIGGGRHAVERVERAHHRGRAGLDRCLVRRQVDLAQADVGHVGGVVLAARLGSAVGGEMLDRGGHALGLRQIGALVAADIGARHRRAEVGVFTGALGRAAPARIARDVDHRRIEPLHARGGRFRRGHVRHVLHQLRIPRGGQAQRHRVDGAVAVDHVGTEQDRDPQAAVHRRFLETTGLLRADHVEHRAQFTLFRQLVGVDMVTGFRIDRDRAFRIGRGGRRRALVVVLHQLADLLGQGHLLQQRVDFLLDGRGDQLRIGRLRRTRKGGVPGSPGGRSPARPAPPGRSKRTRRPRTEARSVGRGLWGGSFFLLWGAGKERARCGSTQM